MNSTEDPKHGAPRINRAMIDLYDEYTHLSLDRRGFMDALTKLAGGAAAAAAAATALAANSAAAALLPETDPRISAVADYAFAGGAGEIRGYLVEPAGRAAPLGGVVVVHENRGLNDHIRDVTRRVAAAGFVALAPDFLSSVGGTPADEDQARELIRALDPEAAFADGVAAAAHLRTHPAVNGRTGAVGFCWGGAMVNEMAVRDPALDAAAAFYGRQPASADAGRIRARLMLHYAGLDERINAGIADYAAALDAAGVAYEMHLYDGVNHAFHNDTSAARYDAAAAELAWSRTIALFEATLR